MAKGMRKVHPNGIKLKDSVCYLEECNNNCHGGSWDEECRPLCKMHATRWFRTGDPLKVKSTRSRAYGIDREADLYNRFVSQLEIGDRSEDGFTRHLLFTGYTQGPSADRQYGRLSGILAHRYAWEKWVGPLGDNHIDHRPECPKNCVNPAHLTPMSSSEHTKLENNRRGAEGRSDLVKQGWITRKAGGSN